jgi:hypothetical protein
MFFLFLGKETRDQESRKAKLKGKQETDTGKFQWLASSKCLPNFWRLQGWKLASAS